MTALTVSARPGNDTALRPVPWRRMAWVTWRQHRLTLAGEAGLLGALAGYLLYTGLPMHHAYAVLATCHPASSLACSNAIVDFDNAHWPTAEAVAVFLQVVPALIGAFAVAPVLARELETGTFRYAWTQGMGRARWTLAKLVPLAVTLAAAAGAFSVLFTWYFAPFADQGLQTRLPPLAPLVFNLHGVAFAAWTLAACSIGALASMLIRRIVPAIAATMAAWAGLALAAGLFLRQHYLTPLIAHNPNLPGSAWIISSWYTGRNGKPLSQAAVSQFLQSYHPAAATQVGPNSFQTHLDPVGYITQHGYTYWVSYQPGSRFWPFQWIEGGYLLGLSVLLITATIWLVRHRAA
jgi:ABC-type transport system involved in multi-copper enzyme maturation permease subunit